MRVSGPWYPVAASVFAGALGAAVLDAVQTVARGEDAARAVLPLVGLGGILALGLAVAAAVLIHAGDAAVPGGLAALGGDEAADRRVAGALCAAAGGAVVIGALVAVGHAAIVGAMTNRELAALASAGLAVAAVVPAAAVAILLRRPAQAIAARLPRLPAWGRTGAAVLGLAALTAGAGAVALSRSDWRVLDLGPLVVLGFALPLGVAHGIFWHASAIGRRLRRREAPRAARVLALLAVASLAIAGAGLREGSPAIVALEDHSWSGRFLLRLARSVGDRDGDGHARWFGGGDCDDGRADVFPGAEDIPDDGIDQNCVGGDATAPSGAPPRADGEGAALEAPALPRAGAFAGNLLLISIDSLRADRLGVAGYDRRGRSLTPHLDALAKRGAYFQRAWAQAPNTPRSFPSFVTSRHPSEIAWVARGQNYSPMAPENDTLFRHLRAAGLRTIGVFSHFYFTPERGLARDFDEWSNEGARSIADSNKDVASPRIVPAVIARLQRAATQRERFVLWTHLFEPHSSYMEHAEFPVRQGGVAGLEEKYDYEIAFVDGWVGKIFAALEQHGLAGNTTVVIWSDHGEAWGEHKRYFHGQDLTEEQLRVPLIVAVPGAAPALVDAPVALIDVAPTLLDLVGLPPPAAFRGRSLLPLVRGEDLPPRPIFAELLPATAWPKHEIMVVEDGWKLTHRITDRRFELHDLARDRFGQRDRSRDPAHQERLARLKERLIAFQERRW